MTAPFHPRNEHGRFQAERLRWYDRKATISRPLLYAVLCILVQPVADDISPALGGLFVLGAMVFLVTDVWAARPRRRER